MKRIAVLTSGGDCSGMNAAIRAVVRAGLSAGLEVVGILRGYQGLIEGDCRTLTTRSVSNILQRGGTVLQSSRCPPMHEERGQHAAAEKVRELGLEGLVVIGGEGSLKGALALHRQGVPVIGMPASIDNDIPGTDISLGVDTALNQIIYAVDSIRDTASSSNRAFVVETMGRSCGYLALAAGVACGAEHILIPEIPEIDIAALAENLSRRYREGRLNSIIMVAEGLASAQSIADRIRSHTELEMRIMVLGHYQRGGSPSIFDRLLGSRFGVAAVAALQQGISGQMISLINHEVQLADLDEIFRRERPPLDEELRQLAETLSI